MPAELLQEGVTAYSAGAGEDITFDLELARYGVDVTIFDPTPRAISHVEALVTDGSKTRFVPIGWWKTKGTIPFYAPANPDHVSHSAVNLQRTSTCIQVAVDTVHHLMDKLGDESVDLIKMDIEGAEHIVVATLLESGPLPRALCLEFDQPSPIWKALRTIRKLRDSGYQLARMEGWNYLFVDLSRLAEDSTVSDG